MYDIGTHVMAFGKSLHAGQKGILTDKYDDMVSIKVDDESYQYAFNRLSREGKYIHVDALLIREIKD